MKKCSLPGVVPRLKYKVQGRPLPKGMSKCIVGFIVTKNVNQTDKKVLQ